MILSGPFALWWLCGAAVLAIAELLVPGVFLIFVAAAAAATGVIVWLAPGLPLIVQAVIAALLSAAAVAAGRRWYRTHPVPTSDPLLNERAVRLLGEIVTVEEAIVDGRGRVRVGDGAWLARGEDAAVDTRVRIVAVEGAVLVVERD